MYVNLDTDPGDAGKIYTITLMKNGEAATPTLQAICDGVQTCNASAEVGVANDDLMSTEIAPTNTPATGQFATISYTAYVP